MTKSRDGYLYPTLAYTILSLQNVGAVPLAWWFGALMLPLAVAGWIIFVYDKLDDE